MSLTMIAGHEVHVDDEGFMTDYDEWNEELAKTLAANIGIELGERHMEAIRFLRDDFKTEGETATLRRVTTLGGIPTKELFQLFPKKPAKKMAYVAGLPKPAGCV
ncbi:MAG TPA: TusE/DsrC/DsvC family sulfur relay protein [Acidimicrobiia bacterium]